MLGKVSVRNFRLFQDFAIDNLARVNLIVGKNNVGKSSLLEALYLLVNPNTPGALLDLFEERVERSFPSREFRSISYDISHLFFGHELTNESLILIQSEGIEPLDSRITFFRKKQRLEERGSPSFLRLEHQGAKGKIDLDIIGKAVEKHDLIRLGHLELARANSNYITTKSFNYGRLAELWDRVNLTPKEDDIVEMVQILEPNVDRISFSSRQTYGILVRFEGQDSPFPLSSMGEGMHHILLIAIALANSENGYLLIDEIDTGLHYRTMADMWNLVFKTAERLNAQVFATTHSSDCIESFDKVVSLEENRALA